MNYLFIDIECANCKDGGKLCEFGYVLTDSSFLVLKRENILINPNTEFDVYVLNHMLNFKKTDYDNSPLFSKFYQKIFNLLTDKDTVVIGHTIGGDAVHIGDDCIRYGFDTPDFEYFDIVEIFKDFKQTDNATSLVNMCIELGIETGENVHSADVDANLTMLVFKTLCEKQGVTAEQMILNSPRSRGLIKDYAETVARKNNYKRYLEDCKEKGIKLIDKDEYNVLRLFRRYSVAREKNFIPQLKGKFVCISENFERENYNQTLVLIQKIKNAGGFVVPSASKCDVFVKYDIPTLDGQGVYCKKLELVKQTIERGKKVQIIEINEFIKLLNIDISALNEPMIKVVEKFIKNKTRQTYSEQTGTTIGEIISSKNEKN